MTDSKLLKARIDASGLKKNYIANQLGITPQGFYLKVSGKNDFTGNQIQILCKLLNISAQKDIKAIFFADKVDEKST